MKIKIFTSLLLIALVLLTLVLSLLFWQPNILWPDLFNTLIWSVKKAWSVLISIAVILGGFATLGMYFEAKKERIKAEAAVERVKNISDEIARMAGNLAITTVIHETQNAGFTEEEKRWMRQHTGALLIARAVTILEKAAADPKAIELVRGIKYKLISWLHREGYSSALTEELPVGFRDQTKSKT